MSGTESTREQLLGELETMRRRVADLERESAARVRAQERIEHLNAVLRAIRNVNQLIVHEKDRDQLLRSTCDSLIETRGYHNAWIALLDEAEELVTTAEAGLGEAFLPLVEQLRRGELTACARQTLAQSQSVAIQDPLSACTDCPLASKYGGRGAMTVRLEHDERIYGLLSVSVPRDLAADEEERSLLIEVARDIAFALRSIELEEERVRAEAALRESEERYRLLVENAPLGIFSTDAQGRIMEVNSKLVSLLVAPSAQALQGTDIHTLPRMVQAGVVADLHRCLESGEPLTAEFHYAIGQDKQSSLRYYLTPIRDQEGQVGGVQGIVEDVSEQRQLEGQLRHAIKMEAIGRVTGVAAHAFRNQLTVINGYSQLILRSLDPSHPLHDDIGGILEAGQRAEDTVRRLLAFSRRQVLDMRVLNLNEVLQGMDKLLRGLIGEDIEIKMELAPDLGNVRSDAGQIEQIIINLAINARDAIITARSEGISSGGDKLVIETANAELDEEYARTHLEAKPGRYALVAVSDTGTGMIAEVQQRIFEPFFTTKAKGEGTGLGLSTVYGIVKQSGGYISVYSEWGRGTIFKIYLPRVDEAQEEQPIEEAGPAVARGGETILLVEDDAGVRHLARHMLERLGYAILEAANAPEALAIFQEKGQAIDLLFTDVIMPEMSGPELAERLRELRPGLPVLYMSGYTDEIIDHHKVLEPGTRLVSKPIDFKKLAAQIREALADAPARAEFGRE